jgi:hypothetical protein
MVLTNFFSLGSLFGNSLSGEESEHPPWTRADQGLICPSARGYLLCCRSSWSAAQCLFPLTQGGESCFPQQQYVKRGDPL